MVLWRRNLYILFGVQFLSLVGFSIVMPFLPLYIKELGVVTGGSIEFWSGMVFSSQGIAMMIAAPIWGVVADRYGRKLMLVRASLGGAILLAAMGFVQNVEQLTLLRFLQGFVTGTVPAANALVAATCPRERTGEALGLIEMGVWGGISVGPLIGGIISETLGFRECFWITGSLLALSGITVIFWVHEDFEPMKASKRPEFLAGYRSLLRAPDMLPLYAGAFLQSLGRTLVLPIAALFVMELMGDIPGVATMTGIALCVRAITGSLSSIWLGKLGDRIGHSKTLFAAFIIGVAFYIPQPFVTSAWQLVVLQALTGLADGGILTCIGALINLRTPSGSQGATFGLYASVNSAGRSVAPMLAAGLAIWFGLRSVFGATAVIYAIATLLALHIKRSDQVTV